MIVIVFLQGRDKMADRDESCSAEFLARFVGEGSTKQTFMAAASLSPICSRW